MYPGPWLAVDTTQALRFFFERLKDVAGDRESLKTELLYNASVLAHFATTSTAAADQFPSSPSSLSTVFDVFVLDRSQHADPEILEAAGSQCLLLTGFFRDQVRHRYNVTWYARLGAGFYARAAQLGSDRRRIEMMLVMAKRFDFWCDHQALLARELRDAPRIIAARTPPPTLDGPVSPQ
jgi:hypothetical protein